MIQNSKKDVCAWIFVHFALRLILIFRTDNIRYLCARSENSNEIAVFSNVTKWFSATPHSTKQRRKEVCSFLSTRAVEWKIATWGLFIKGKFRSSQMCSNFSKQLKLHNSHKRIIPAVRHRFVNTCRNLSFFVSVLSTIPDNMPKNYAGRFSSFLFCSFYTLTLVSLAYFICLISGAKITRSNRCFQIF